MKAILIDPKRREVKGIEIAINHDAFSAVFRGGMGWACNPYLSDNVLYFGLYVFPPAGQKTFMLKGYPKAVIGRGLLFGFSPAGVTATKLTVREVENVVVFGGSPDV